MPPFTDSMRLTRLLELESLGVAVYTLALRSGALTNAAEQLVSELRTQELAHVKVLSRLHGVRQPQALHDHGEIQAELKARGIKLRLAKLSTERDWFTLLEDIESMLTGAYYEAMGKLTRRDATTLAATIFAIEAQHQTVLFHQRNPTDIDLDVAGGPVVGTPPSWPTRH
jgi:hypothetical protein